MKSKKKLRDSLLEELHQRQATQAVEREFANASPSRLPDLAAAATKADIVNLRAEILELKKFLRIPESKSNRDSSKSSGLMTKRECAAHIGMSESDFQILLYFGLDRIPHQYWRAPHTLHTIRFDKGKIDRWMTLLKTTPRTPEALGVSEPKFDAAVTEWFRKNRTTAAKAKASRTTRQRPPASRSTG